jgi:ATP-dependent exoDNAse (exonuclease V) beta subunit
MLVNPEIRARWLAAVQDFLERLYSHSLFEEIEGTLKRHHRVARMWPLPGARSDIGVIDPICRTAVGWRLVDFKTDQPGRESKAVEAAGAYLPRVERQHQTVRPLLGNELEGRFCFLDCSGSVCVL